MRMPVRTPANIPFAPLAAAEASPVLSVDALTNRLKGLLDRDVLLKALVVKGEIHEFKRHTSGHCYFTLLGEGSRIGCALFKPYASLIPLWPKDGDMAVIEGSVEIYAPRGIYQLCVRRLVPVGEGAIERARQEVKARIEKEGLFSPRLKRPMPRYPLRVGLISSPTGAAVRDVVKVARLRWPLARLLLFPTQVQGASAIGEIVAQLRATAAVPGLDCLMLVRGGGAREDLIPFDDEEVVRAVRGAVVPVVTGIGHEQDRTLSDLAADLAAATPSAAAERLFPDQWAVRRQLEMSFERMRSLISSRIGKKRDQLQRGIVRHARALSQSIQGKRALHERAQRRMIEAMARRMAGRNEALAVLSARLQALSPLAVLERGFVICERAGQRVVSARDLAPGDRFCVSFRDGTVDAEVLCEPLNSVPSRKREVRG
jgi:exodeoxyribonuclease VII large subunit